MRSRRFEKTTSQAERLCHGVLTRAAAPHRSGLPYSIKRHHDSTAGLPVRAV